MGAETTKHKIVALIFDPQTEREAGFALSATSAKTLADDLVKAADTVTNYRSSAVRKPIERVLIVEHTSELRPAGVRPAGCRRRALGEACKDRLFSQKEAKLIRRIGCVEWRPQR